MALLLTGETLSDDMVILSGETIFGEDMNDKGEVFFLLSGRMKRSLISKIN